MSYIITDRTITIFHGRPYTADRSTIPAAQWDWLIDALNNGDYATAVKLIDVPTAVNTYFDGEIQVEGGRILYRGQPVDTYPAQKALEFMRNGLPYKPLLAFIRRLEANPSYRARQDLYAFLEYGQNPLTDDGCFLAYKKVVRVDGRLMDIYSRTFNNEPGEVVTVPRNQVDEDPDRTCSHGLHVCSYGYLPHFGSGNSHADAVVVVKVDPADVVAIPHDYSNTKMRVCRYQVLEVLEDVSTDVLRNDGPLSERDAPDEDAEAEVPNTDDWIAWDGDEYTGPSAYDPSTEVEVRLRDGTTMTGLIDIFDWESQGDEGDIVAYRLC